MARSRDLRRFFWEQIAAALRLREVSISEKGRGNSHRIIVSGNKSGFKLETGAYWEGSGESSVPYTFTAVAVEGLPQGLRIDSQLVGFSIGGQALVSCGDERTRTVTVDSTPVQLGELRLQQVSVDLEEFLTLERRRAICLMESRLNWIGGGHQLEQRIPEEPYPKKRVLAAALSGDPSAVQTLSKHSDRVVALVEDVLSDAGIATEALRVAAPESGSS